MSCDASRPCGGAIRDETIADVRIVRCVGGAHTLLVERTPDTRTATLTALIAAEAKPCDVCGWPILTEGKRKRHAKCRRVRDA